MLQNICSLLVLLSLCSKSRVKCENSLRSNISHIDVIDPAFRISSLTHSNTSDNTVAVSRSRGTFLWSSSKEKKTLIWQSNNAGLFSHFFQTKYMYALAANLSRTLTIALYTDSTHAKDSVVLCDIFNFTSNIICS